MSSLHSADIPYLHLTKTQPKHLTLHSDAYILHRSHYTLLYGLIVTFLSLDDGQSAFTKLGLAEKDPRILGHKASDEGSILQTSIH